MNKPVWISLLLLITFQQSIFADTSRIKYELDPRSNSSGVKSRALTITVGNADRSRFIPELKISAWNDECTMIIDMADGKIFDYDAPVVHSRNNAEHLILAENPVRTQQLYKRTDGNIEWDIILNSPPDTNVFIFPFSSDGLRFVKQDTAFIDPETRSLSTFPDSTLGAWVAYHKTGRNNRIIINGPDTVRENYGTGVAFTVYRPQVYDRHGHSIWGELTIDTLSGRLIISVSSEFLKQAAYPVTIDPTIGQTTALPWSTSARCGKTTYVLNGRPQTASVNGICTNGYVYARSVDARAVCSVQVSLWKRNYINCDSITYLGKTNKITFTTSGGTVWFGGALSDSIRTGTTYVVGWKCDDDYNAMEIYYGLGQGGVTDIYYLADNDWTDPATMSGCSGLESDYSIYIEYTVSSTVPLSPRRKRILSGGYQ